MAVRIQGNENIPHLPLERIEDHCIEKTIDAVADFFARLVRQIIDCAVWCWNKLKERCGLDPVEDPALLVLAQAVLPNVFAPAAVAVKQNRSEKLESYQNMPRSDIPFLQRSIDLLREVLLHKDERLLAALHRDLGTIDIPKDQLPNHLGNFNEELAIVAGEAVPKVLMAALRAALFSNTDYCPSFIKGHKVKVNDEPLQFGGRRIVPQIDVYKSYKENLKDLKNLFNELPTKEQEVIIDEFDADIGQLPISDVGKRILRDLGAMCNDLVQNNKPFFDALAKVH